MAGILRHVARRSLRALTREQRAAPSFAMLASARAMAADAGKKPKPKPAPTVAPFAYQELFEPASPKDVPWRKITSAHVSVEKAFDGKDVLVVEPEALRVLAAEGMKDIAHLLRPGHLQQLANILKDPEASENDRFVALELLKNANVAAGMVLPGCQDTGTAIVMGKRGVRVMTRGDDEAHLSRGVYDVYVSRNLRYSQVAPVSMYEEKNTGSNLPAQIDLIATDGDEYHFQFMAKGGGSANKTFLYQETKALLNETRMMAFLEEKIKTLGTAACPPYHLALVVGGLSAEQCLKTVKLASARYYDNLHAEGNAHGRAFRDAELEKKVHALTQARSSLHWSPYDPVGVVNADP